MATTRLPPDFSELLKLLNARGVEYLIIGGWAVVAHGYYRLTADFDLWIASSRENAERLQTVIEAFIGIKPTLAQILAPGKFLRMGREPHRIEVLHEIAGVTFAECYAARELFWFNDVQAPTIDLKNLLRNKRAAGRHKDLADVEYLTKYHKIAGRKKKK
jgi:hypothetical protein